MPQRRTYEDPDTGQSVSFNWDRPGEPDDDYIQSQFQQKRGDDATDSFFSNARVGSGSMPYPEDFRHKMEAAPDLMEFLQRGPRREADWKPGSEASKKVANQRLSDNVVDLRGQRDKVGVARLPQDRSPAHEFAEGGAQFGKMMMDAFSRGNEPFDWAKEEDSPVTKAAKQINYKGWPAGQMIQQNTPFLNMAEPMFEAGKMLAGSPVDAAQTALTGPYGVARTAAAKGVGVVAKGARAVANTLDLAGGSKALYEAGEELSKGNYLKGAGNVARAGMTALGLASGKKPTRYATSENPLEFDPRAPKVDLAEPIEIGNVKVTKANPTAMPYTPPKPTSFPDAFKTWVNERDSARVAGFAKAKEVENLDHMGTDAFIAFQKNPNHPEFAGMRKYFDDKFKTLQNAKVKLGYKEDYLPQLWENGEKLSPAKQAKLGLKPTFTLESVVKSYQEGIDMGLKPKFKNMSELVNWYESYTNKAIANQQFFTAMRQAGEIKPVLAGKKAPDGWVVIDPKVFPSIVNPKTGMTHNYMAPASRAKQIETYLNSYDGAGGLHGSKKLEKFANAASSMKDVALSTGIPGTGINMHGVNILARNAMSDQNPVAGFLTGAKYLANPKAAQRQFDKNLSSAQFASRHGLTLGMKGTEDFDRVKLKGVPGQVQAIHDKLFADPLFQQVIPNLKLERFNTIYSELTKAAKTPNEIQTAARQAAEMTNNIFGGINWREIGESKQYQNFLRSTILAPDWLRTNLRLGKETGKGVAQALADPQDPVGKQYRVIARNLVTGYMAANIMNYGSTGHMMHKNDPGHEFDIEIGMVTGPDGKEKKRYLRPFGTAADFARVPLASVTSIARGDPEKVVSMARSRTSMPVGAGIDALFGDYKGDTLFSDKYGKAHSAPDVGKRALSGLADLITPPYMRSGFDLMMGDIGPEEALSRGVELPLGYARPFVPPEDRKKRTRGIPRRP